MTVALQKKSRENSCCVKNKYVFYIRSFVGLSNPFTGNLYCACNAHWSKNYESCSSYMRGEAGFFAVFGCI